MLVLDHYLRIGNRVFPTLTSAVIESSRDTVSDTATIELPKYRRLNPNDIKEGDEVVFRAGYKQYGLCDEFFGVVREVSQTDKPMVVRAEDYYYYLRDTVSKTFGKIYAGDIAKQICQGTPIDTSKVQKGIYINYLPYWNKSKRFIVEDLAKRCGFDAFMRGRYLIFDKPFSENSQEDVPVYQYGVNIIEEDLKFRVDNDYDRVVVISEKTDGSGVIFKGVAGKGKKTLTIYLDNLSAEDAIKRAQEIYDDVTYKGFAGMICTFGYPPCYHSWQIQVVDDRFPGKSGQYLADKVQKTYGRQGYRQEITLGKKAATIKKLKSKWK